ncbi:hypothetical protein CLU79DRAFT_725861 [Phycomyces nitens]|nr:hypothetical protein CLU79DRAFT_725861 [Phycomyces nitens]
MECSPRSTPVPRKIKIHWSCVKVPSCVRVASVLQHLRDHKQSPLATDTSNEAGQESLQSLFENQKIETVRKQSFFSEEVTEEERDIIAQRVALQQRQFAEFERREKNRKSIKIRQMFDHVNDEEITEMLQDCNQDEDEAIYRLTKPEYLTEIRKTVASNYHHIKQETGPSMNAAQKAAYQQLIKKRSETLKKTATDLAKKQYRMGGRLGLDEALQQVQNNHVNPEKAFEGWSHARIRAYQMIDQNPNSYYYRFNAPGEIQRKGQWTESEKKLFHQRLDEVGANGQWGIFSIKIPGRVGYQCSNYYRLLVETKKIKDPNYVIDERGKSHYLFDKKTSTGHIEKGFRTHNKPVESDEESVSSPKPSGSTMAGSLASSSTKVTQKAPTGRSPSTTASSGARAGAGPRAGTGPRSPSTAQTPSAPLKRITRSTAPPVDPTQKKKRRRALYDTESESSSEEEESDDYDQDESPSTRSTKRNASQAPVVRRQSKRCRRPTAAAIAAGLVDASSYTWNAPLETEDDDQDTRADEHPLPGFIDPITLEEVVKPALSKYGHVMGYDSWVRCLTSWEGKRNTCPLTKKPLTKRDLGKH